MPLYERNNQALELKTHNQSINQTLNPAFQYFSTVILFCFFVCLTLNYCWKFNFKNLTILQPPHDITFRRVRYWRVLIDRKLNSIHLYVNKWVWTLFSRYVFVYVIELLYVWAQSWNYMKLLWAFMMWSSKTNFVLKNIMKDPNTCHSVPEIVRFYCLVCLQLLWVTM